MRIFKGTPSVKIQIEVSNPEPSFLESILGAAREVFAQGAADAAQADGDRGRGSHLGGTPAGDPAGDADPQASSRFQIYEGAPRSTKKPCHCTGKRAGAAAVSGVRRGGG